MCRSAQSQFWTDFALIDGHLLLSPLSIPSCFLKWYAATVELKITRKAKSVACELRKRVAQNALFFSVVTSAALLASCHAKSSTLEVHGLLAGASHYNQHVVTFHGCYLNGLEKQIIRACVEPKPGELIWVVPYSEIEDSERAISGYRARSTKTDPPTPHERDLYAELGAMPDGAVSEVVVRGEFQYSEVSPYGHAPGYKYELILYRVLSSRKQ